MTFKFTCTAPPCWTSKSCYCCWTISPPQLCWYICNECKSCLQCHQCEINYFDSLKSQEAQEKAACGNIYEESEKEGNAENFRFQYLIFSDGENSNSNLPVLQLLRCVYLHHQHNQSIIINQSSNHHHQHHQSINHHHRDRSPSSCLMWETRQASSWLPHLKNIL